MQKKTSKLTALLLASMIALSGCGGNGGNGGNTNNGGDAKPEGGSTTASDTKKDDKKDEKKDDKKDAKSDERITDLVLPVAVSRELETFNILYAQRQEDSENLTNLVDCLLAELEELMDNFKNTK